MAKSKREKRNPSILYTTIAILLLVTLAPLFLSGHGPLSFVFEAPTAPAAAGPSREVAVLSERLENLAHTQKLIDGLLADIKQQQSAPALPSSPAAQSLAFPPAAPVTAAAAPTDHAASASSFTVPDRVFNPGMPELAEAAASSAGGVPPSSLVQNAPPAQPPSMSLPAKKPRKVWRSSDTDSLLGGSFSLTTATSPNPNNKGGLACAANLSIAVSPSLAAQLGGWFVYDRSSTPRCARSQISHKMEPGCSSSSNGDNGGGSGGGAATPPPVSQQRQILVVGVQRSGTHYTWEMFNRLGVHVHHEGLGPHGAVSWFFAYKARNYAINNPEPLKQHTFCFVFHQVRHPMRVVSSIVKASKKAWDPYWDWLVRTEPRVCGTVAECKATPLLQRSAKQWLSWNEHIELYADARFRVEDTSPRAVCRLAMLPERLCGSDGRYHTTSSKCGNCPPHDRLFVISDKVIQPVVEPQAPADGHTGVDQLAASWDAIAKLDQALVQEMQAMTTRYGYHLDPAMHPQSLSTEAFRAGGLDSAAKKPPSARRGR